jgi:hypothetical protein
MACDSAARSTLRMWSSVVGDGRSRQQRPTAQHFRRAGIRRASLPCAQHWQVRPTSLIQVCTSRAYNRLKRPVRAARAAGSGGEDRTAPLDAPRPAPQASPPAGALGQRARRPGPLVGELGARGVAIGAGGRRPALVGGRARGVAARGPAWAGCGARAKAASGEWALGHRGGETRWHVAVRGWLRESAPPTVDPGEPSRPTPGPPAWGSRSRPWSVAAPVPARSPVGGSTAYGAVTGV